MNLYKPKAGYAPAVRDKKRLWPAIYDSIKDWAARVGLVLMIAVTFYCGIMGVWG